MLQEAISGPSSADSHLPRQLHCCLWMSKLSVTETSIEHTAWHCPLRRPIGYLMASWSYPILFIWKDHLFNFIWIINTFWVWVLFCAHTTKPEPLSGDLQQPDPQMWLHIHHQIRDWHEANEVQDEKVLKWPLPLRVMGCITHHTIKRLLAS